MLGPQFYRPTEGMKGLSQPCPVQGENLGYVVWECESQPPEPDLPTVVPKAQHEF